jgi:recombination protein RecR
MSPYKIPEELKQLASALSALPGVGPKMANRLSIYLATRKVPSTNNLIQALTQVVNNIGICPKTGNITAHGQVDPLFTDPNRNRSQLLVVESPLDLIQIEESAAYNGLYCVLGGLISPLNGISPHELAMDRAVDLAKTEPLTEVIVALSSTVEGEATALYLISTLQKVTPSLSFTRLARGLPNGVSIEFLDGDTLSSAFKHRSAIE